MWKIVFLGLFLLKSAAFAEDACPADIKKNTASISVGFHYSGVGRPLTELKNTISDLAFYQMQMGFSASDKPRIYHDQTSSGRGKTAFLKALKKDVMNKEYVLFNYAGHGVPNHNNQWSMVLPGMPATLTSECGNFLGSYIGAIERPSSDPKKCIERLDEFLVSDEDLRSVFQDKKVLFFNDSCYAGKARLGKNVTHVAAALSDQVASDNITGTNGAFTEKIKSRFNECPLDTDKNGMINAQELVARFASATPDTISKNRKLAPKTAAIPFAQTNPSEILQHMTIQNEQPWIRCMTLGASTCPATPAKPGAKNIK